MSEWINKWVSEWVIARNNKLREKYFFIQLTHSNHCFVSTSVNLTTFVLFIIDTTVNVVIVVVSGSFWQSERRIWKERNGIDLFGWSWRERGWCWCCCCWCWRWFSFVLWEVKKELIENLFFFREVLLILNPIGRRWRGRRTWSELSLEMIS